MPQGSELANMVANDAKMVAKVSPNWTPTWSPKMMPTWLYRQDFAKFSLNRHYNAHEIHRGQKLVVRLSLVLALSITQVTVRFSSVPPQFCGRTPWGWSETSLPLPPTSREDLRFVDYLEYPHAAKELYAYKHTCLLRDSKGPTALQSASLTTITG
ncbi:hypothetical protein TNCV_2056911 [Trichonephila clavipes]|nr:hypothetical protein TNCV_2056911 [Trichonephila clavipes]